MRLSRALPAFAVLLAACAPQPPPSVANDGYGDYLLVPAGPFEMGDNFDEGNSDERPVHTVHLDAYYVGRYKITNAQYGRFIAAGGYQEPSYWEAGGFGEHGTAPAFWTEAAHFGGGLPGNGQYPVVGVSWFEAVAYTRWLSHATGQAYRLPTEAEWEKAARGLDQRRFGWGDEIDATWANYDHGQPRSEMTLVPAGFHDGTVRNGESTNANRSPYGALGMVGNVSEWCADWYDREYYTRSPRDNPQGPAEGASRVLRAGGYVDSAYYQRAAGRHKTDAHFKSFKTGFRCVRDVPGAAR